MLLSALKTIRQTTFKSGDLIKKGDVLFYVVLEFLGFEFSRFSLLSWQLDFFFALAENWVSHVTPGAGPLMGDGEEKYLRLLKNSKSLQYSVFYHPLLSKRLIFRHKLFHVIHVLSFQGQFITMCLCYNKTSSSLSFSKPPPNHLQSFLLWISISPSPRPWISVLFTLLSLP